MLRFIESIFGKSSLAGNYPESLVKAAIERAVDGTDPWIRAVSGYKKRLRPAVVRAIDHVISLVDGLEAPIDVDSSNYGCDPRLRTFFISNADMQNIFDRDRNLKVLLRGHNGDSPRVIALLVMEKQEKIILGAELAGDIVLRDVPLISVSFEAHRLIEPSISETETRRQLKRRAYDHLLSLALKRIAIVKSERGKLERYRVLLQSKLSLLQRGGWGFYENDVEEHLDVDKVEDLLGKIETQLLEIGGDDRMLDVYLDIVTDVLSRPEKHLWFRNETLNLDRMGIKRNEVFKDAEKVSLGVMCNDEGRNLVVSLVSLSGFSRCLVTQ